jgi:hypothetical protein
VAEKEPIQIVYLPQPTQCILWENPDSLTGKFLEVLEAVETYEDTSHLTHSLYKCRECGQLYFHEWYDWHEDNDKRYPTLIPVQTSEEIAALKLTLISKLITYFPCLQLDGGKPRWTGKD